MSFVQQARQVTISYSSVFALSRVAAPAGRCSANLRGHDPANLQEFPAESVGGQSWILASSSAGHALLRATVYQESVSKAVSPLCAVRLVRRGPKPLWCFSRLKFLDCRGHEFPPFQRMEYSEAGTCRDKESIALFAFLQRRRTRQWIGLASTSLTCAMTWSSLAIPP